MSAGERTCPCRACGEQVNISAERCPKCGLRPPFFCSQCGRSVGPISLMQSPSRQHPHGSFAEDGQPLCYLHRLTACHCCGELKPQQEMSYLVTGTHADYHLRPKGGPPRIEEVLEMVCTGCAPTHAGGADRPVAKRALLWMAAGVVVCLLLALVHPVHF